MPTYLKKIVKKFLLQLDIFSSRVTDRAEMLTFLRSIYPVNTNHDLIRIGCNHDGGYLIPNDISDIKFCFSPGVSNVADFENHLTRMGIRCFMADYSVDSPPIKNPLFDFEKKYLGLINNDKFLTLDMWVHDKAPNSNDLLLQMDIEGSEYKVILDASRSTLCKFRILVIEFHGLDNLLNKLSFEMIDLTFAKLLNDFEIVHAHPNNYCKPLVYRGLIIPTAIEFTFLRKDRVLTKNNNIQFPHPLDQANDPCKLDIALPSCWQ